MMPILPAICFIAARVCSTAWPPSIASFAALPAMPSVTLALSVFCAIEAVICSTEALVSSTLAACSLEAWLMDCAVALTSSEAADRASAAVKTSRNGRVTLMVINAEISAPITTAAMVNQIISVRALS